VPSHDTWSPVSASRGGLIPEAMTAARPLLPPRELFETPEIQVSSARRRKSREIRNRRIYFDSRHRSMSFLRNYLISNEHRLIASRKSSAVNRLRDVRLDSRTKLLSSNDDPRSKSGEGRSEGRIGRKRLPEQPVQTDRDLSTFIGARLDKFPNRESLV